MISTIPLRKAHRLELDEYGFAGEHCYWLEMDHQFERVPDFKTIFDYYALQNHWAKWIKPGMTCIDIGGHSGDTAIPMMVYSRATVLTVEPNHTIRPYLELNCNANKHLGGKFVIASQAVTNKNSDNLIFKDHHNGLCNGGLLGETWDSETQARMASMSGQSIQVSGLTLDSMLQNYLSQEEIERVGFVKTDTEGHDIEIIRNIRDFLIQYKPVLFTEWFAQYSQTDSAELFRVIEDAGYVPFYPESMNKASLDLRSEDLLCLHQDNI